MKHERYEWTDGCDEMRALELAVMVAESRGIEVTPDSLDALLDELETRLAATRQTRYAELLREARAGKHMSAEYVAHALGISQAEYELMEADAATIQAETLIRLSGLLDVPVRDLCDAWDKGYDEAKHEAVFTG